MLPPELKPGDTIGFFSPSSPATAFAPNRTERAIQFLESKGFNVVAGSLTGQSDHYRSGSIQERAAELNTLIENENIRCIMSTIGGANSNSLLPFINYDAIRQNPKIFVGYSDVTAILLGIYAKTGLVTFYGPALTASLGELPPLVDETFNDFLAATNSAEGSRLLPTPAHWTDQRLDWEHQTHAKDTYVNDVQYIGSGTVQGRLIGGNLNTMTGIWGSPYMPIIERGDILLIEDSLKDIATVERLLVFLKINNIFDKVSAVILGKHELFEHSGTNRKPIDVLQEVLNGQDLPIVNDFDCAHTHPMLTLPIGATVNIDFSKNQVSVVSPSVRAV